VIVGGLFSQAFALIAGVENVDVVLVACPLVQDVVIYSFVSHAFSLATKEHQTSCC